MKYKAFLVTAMLLSSTAGCTEQQLNLNTRNLTATITRIEYDQILDNLAAFIDKPSCGPLPSMVLLSGGSVQVSDQVGPTFKIPFPGIVTYEGDFAAQNQWTQNWSITPVTDPMDLLRLRALFAYAASDGAVKAPIPPILVLDQTTGLPVIADGKTTPTIERKVVDFPATQPTNSGTPTSEPGADSKKYLTQPFKNFTYTDIPLKWYSTDPCSNGRDMGIHGSKHIYITDEDGFARFCALILTSMANTEGGGGGGGSGGGGGAGGHHSQILLEPVPNPIQ